MSGKKKAAPKIESVKLRVFKGVSSGERITPGILKNDKGEIVNENQLVSLIYGSTEWRNYLKTLNSSQWMSVEVEKYCLDGKQVKCPDNIIEEVQKALKGNEKEKELTPEQKKIADLEKDAIRRDKEYADLQATVANMSKGQAPEKKETKKEAPEKKEK